MVGQQIGEFRIIEKLGEGGMGVVYKAIDVRLDRPVAIKMLSAGLTDNPELVQRFQSEARAQANLNHTNLAILYAFLIDQGRAYMVMEFVEGETFDQIIRRNGPINPNDAVPWFKQALLGIGAAHRVGIIHRDIKPSNLMLNRQGIVKVMDFGIAKAVGTRGMTRTGTQLGTLAYMSPEQIQNRTIDVRSDIYSLGITLYEMLSGHVPFEGESDFQMMQDHVNTPPPALTRYYPYAPKEFENVVAKALAKNPDDRFQTVEEFGVALEHPERISASAPGVVLGQVPRTAGRTVIDSGSEGWRGNITAPPQETGSGSGPLPNAAPTIADSHAATTGELTAPGTHTQVSTGAKKLPPRIVLTVAAGAVAALAIAIFLMWPSKPAPAPIASGGGAGGGGSAPSAFTDKTRSASELLSGGGDSSDTNNAPPANNLPVSIQPPSTAPTRNASSPPQTPHKQTIAGNQGYPPAAQTQQPAYQPSPAQQQPWQEAQSFIVKHRHVVGSGVQTQTYYCAGPLMVKPDGTVTYSCAGTNDPSKRCEHVTFPPGTIKQLQIRGESELHMGTTSMGNWDFYDYNVAGATTGAYQAILPFVR